MAVDPQIEEFAKWLAEMERPEDVDKAIKKARGLAVAQLDDTAFEPPIRTLGKYLADPIEVPPVLVEPYIVVRGGLTCTIGRAGKGKTVMNLNRILRWSAGLPMFDDWKDEEGNDNLAPSKPLKTLVIENEGAGGLFHRQIGLMLHAEDYMTKEARETAKENVLIWGDGGYSGLKLDDPAKLEIVRQGCEIWKPDIVFVEPFRGLWNGEENSSTDMAVVVDALVEIAADFQCGVMLAHHERKSGAGEDGEKMSAGRGSTVLEGAVTVMENFESVVKGKFRELTWSKSRHGKAPNPVRMEWDSDAWWYSHSPASQIEETVISALREFGDEAMSISDLAEHTNENKNKLREACKVMKDDSRIVALPSMPLGNGGTTGPRYRLPSGDDNSTGGIGF
jgi:hypothetical protein